MFVCFVSVQRDSWSRLLFVVVVEAEVCSNVELLPRRASVERDVSLDMTGTSRRQ